MATVVVYLRRDGSLPRIRVREVNTFEGKDWMLHVWQIGHEDIQIYRLSKKDLRNLASEILQAMDAMSDEDSPSLLAAAKFAYITLDQAGNRFVDLGAMAYAPIDTAMQRLAAAIKELDPSWEPPVGRGAA